MGSSFELLPSFPHFCEVRGAGPYKGYAGEGSTVRGPYGYMIVYHTILYYTRLDCIILYYTDDIILLYFVLYCIRLYHII